MAVLCPLIGKPVRYLTCQECEHKLCKEPTLPYKVGDKIYIRSPYAEDRIESLDYDGTFVWAILSNPEYVPEHKNTKRCIEFDWLKTIFPKEE